MKKPAAVALFLVGSAFVFMSLKIYSPYELFLHGFGVLFVAMASLVVLALLIRQKAWRGTSGKLLIVLWCLPVLSMLYAHAAVQLCKRGVLMTENRLAILVSAANL
jgi:beta-N-acetylhexosaminidase